MNLQSNDFELFDVQPRFAQDMAALQERWKALQREAHPDRFAAQGSSAQRVAMQWSVRINEAWQRLRDPLRRAAYLCELHGVAIDKHGNTKMPPAFLMRQMAWHERLEEAQSVADCDVLAQELTAERENLLQRCARLLDEAADYAGAAEQVRALMFIERLFDAVDDRRDACSSAGALPSEGQ
ncbi:Fe-S protein assembly co-chaperone HscB [Pseudorhodoferax sp. Leaf267]|uniref:Fe-S protein assembly co-chaperone HscB n=1 Tax=Pseudorhodoferax sp. Leaf267 TaxID=1736316 RepID=UPI0006FBC5A3|nr:Fe-S protein assembly co-chaperone HscB [Pseudorhodoferax sp. Leaf267]KQP22114.1 co-chaperone HscB [Pseudorhodoferax sp. Leaf267]